jgi:hypothetical protein
MAVSSSASMAKSGVKHIGQTESVRSRTVLDIGKPELIVVSSDLRVQALSTELLLSLEVEIRFAAFD